MENTELLDNLHTDLKKLNISYEAHAQIQNIMQAYRQQLSQMEEKKDKKKD